MFLSLALIIVLSISLFAIFDKLNLPGLLAFIITGIILGPFVLDLISEDILNISADLRKIALVVILIRAGLSLDINDLKAVGRPAIMLSFLPAIFEIILIGVLAPLLFNITSIEGFILGSVIAAVSPAVIVPRMIALIEKKLGTEHKIPQLILASSSIDDIFVIVIFTIFLQIYETNSFEVGQLFLLPVSLILGILSGLFIGVLLVYLFKKIHLRDTLKVMILFSISFLFIVLEDYLPISGLLAIITLGITVLALYPVLANRLTSKFSKIWVIAEMMLFVLIGAAVDITLFTTIGLLAIVLVLSGLVFRMFGVIISITRTKFDFKEKTFICFSYIPKATVQAAIGAIPLSLGIPGGELILAISVLSIFLTAPIGAILIDQTAHNLLHKNRDN
ncbi:MAG: cation:proton antiporter [Tenericutes bacterium]|jgi:NhaP-type Na+/H+ or K+/H+ antiporter|nr:cation:proton antiporter [Mycoplasmatota bacterium]